MPGLGQIRSKLRHGWRRFWVKRSGPSGLGKTASKLAAWNTVPYHARTFLTNYGENGYFAPGVAISHRDVAISKGSYVGDDVFIFADPGEGKIRLAQDAKLYGRSYLRTAEGGSIIIGEGTHIQMNCVMAACISNIEFGRKVEIAPNCSFYSFNHGMKAGTPIMEQPLTSNGPIIVDDEAWLGDGVKVLGGVHIGKGAVVGAGSVVTRDIPENAIAVGIPAKVVSMRS